MLNTIRSKVTIWTIVIVGILNIFLSTYIYLIINNTLEKSIQENMDTIRFMAKNIAMMQSDGNGEQWQSEDVAEKIVDGLYDIYNEYIAISINNEDILKSRGNILNENKVNEIIQESKNKKSLLMLTKEEYGYIATYNYPIYIGDYFYGNIVVQKNYYREYSENSKIIITIFAGQLISILLLVIAIWYIVNKFTRPLNELSNAIKSFGNGKEQQDIIIKSKDEVALLAENFNLMKNEIQNQINVIMEEKNKNKDFFNNATHELKTPITAISGYAELLSCNDIEEIEKDFRDRALERILKESNKMNMLVKNLLEISRGTSKSTVPKIEVRLDKLLENKLSEMKIRLNKGSIIIDKYIQEVTVRCNKEELNTILVNLIDNAIKYTANNSITINIYVEKENCIFEVTNEIYSIPENIKDKLLEPFVKYVDDNVLEREGITSSGIGLFICSKLAEENNGNLLYKIENNKIKIKLILPKVK